MEGHVVKIDLDAARKVKRDQMRAEGAEDALAAITLDDLL